MWQWTYHVASHSRQEILSAINDTHWQNLRLSLKGVPTEQKLIKLKLWLEEQQFTTRSRIQVDNYINALKRGGQLDMDLRVKR